MKTILILTDLKKKSDQVALYGLKLAEKINANIILFHSFSVFQSVAIPEMGMWPVAEVEEVQTDCIMELKRLADRLSTHHQPGNFKPAITILATNGDLAAKVSDLVTEKHIDLVVMGAKGDDVISHVLFGSETSSVIDEVKCPILFVPEHCMFQNYKTIVFSTDLKKAYPKAVSYLIDLAGFDKSHIIVTHIGDVGDFTHNQAIDLIKNVFEYNNVVYKQIPEGDITEQLNKFTTLVQADLTVMIHHHHTLFGSIIPGSNSKKMLYSHKTPLLVLPD
jgi:nucleotide-binding universal stress UspA family protein